MKEEIKLEVAKMAMQLTIELMSDGGRQLASFQRAIKLKDSNILSAYDHIYNHLSQTFKEQ